MLEPHITVRGGSVSSCISPLGQWLLTEPANTNSRLAAYFSKILVNRKELSAANDNAIEIRDGTVVLNIFAGSQKIATRTLGTITDILGAGSSLRITYIDPSNRFVRFFPWLCMLLTLLMLASFRPVGPPQLPLSPLRGPLPILVRGEFNRAPILGMIFRLALEGRDRTLHSKGRERVILPLLTLWHHYTSAMSEALQSFPKNALQKSISLGLIATIFLTSIPMPAFAAAAETDFFYYHHGDHLGSTNVITEGNTSAIHSGITYSRGTLVQRFEYSPYGQESYVLNPGLDLEVSYTGQDYDVESGLYYYNSRYYNPQLGRFIQPDTIIPDPSDLQSYNRYSYVKNNPLKYTDPTGHFSIGYGGGGIGIGTGGSMGYGGNFDTGGYVGGVLNFSYNIMVGAIMTQVNTGGPDSGECIAEHVCDSFSIGAPEAPIQKIAETPQQAPLPLPVTNEDIPGGGFGEVLDKVDYGLDALEVMATTGEIGDANVPLVVSPVIADITQSSITGPAGASIDRNIREAMFAKLSGRDMTWFYDQVRNKGPWDYKQEVAAYQDFGNFNYGATGAAFGFSEATLLRMAGWAQVRAGTSRPEWGKPTNMPASYFGIGGVPPFGDDPHDQAIIKLGIQYYRNHKSEFEK